MQTMAKHYPDLVRRGNIFYVRKHLPDAIRDILGRNEINISLDTGDRPAAIKKYWPVRNKIEAARKQLSSDELII